MTSWLVRRIVPSTLIVRSDMSGEVVTMMTSTTSATTLPTPAVQVRRRWRVDTVKRRYSARSALFRARVALRAERVASFDEEGFLAFFTGVAGAEGPKPLGLLGVAIDLSHSSKESWHNLVKITRAHRENHVTRLCPRHGELDCLVPVGLELIRRSLIEPIEN